MGLEPTHWARASGQRSRDPLSSPSQSSDFKHALPPSPAFVHGFWRIKLKCFIDRVIPTAFCRDMVSLCTLADIELAM